MPSSVVAYYRYDEKDNSLYVHFVSGTIYRYLNVPARLYEGMKRAVSKGKYLNTKIKGSFDFDKIA